MKAWINGEVALVTGSSSGIGRAAALAFASQGAKVVVASRRVDESIKTVELIRAAGGDARFIQTDVTRSNEVDMLVKEAIATYGQLNFAFNNAGIEGDPFVSVENYPESTWDEVIDVNLKGVFLCMKYELPCIAKTKGAIVNMASVAGLTGGLLGAAYYASKHGVVGLTKAASLEYARQGVRVNAVAPAVIETDLAQRAFFKDDEFGKKVVKLHPLGRVGRPEEVANAVVWLCSDGASFTTGHTLTVDGGYLVP